MLVVPIAASLVARATSARGGSEAGGAEDGTITVNWGRPASVAASKLVRSTRRSVVFRPRSCRSGYTYVHLERGSIKETFDLILRSI